MYILLRNKILLFPKLYQKPPRPIVHYSLVVNMEEGNFTNFKNSYKINENSYIHIFFQWRSGEKEDLYQRKKFGGRGVRSALKETINRQTWPSIHKKTTK